MMWNPLVAGAGNTIGSVGGTFTVVTERLAGWTSR